MAPSYLQKSLGNFVPQSDEQAFKTAFYNAIAFVFLFAVSVLLICIYHLLHAFIRYVIEDNYMNYYAVYIIVVNFFITITTFYFIDIG